MVRLNEATIVISDNRILAVSTRRRLFGMARVRTSELTISDPNNWQFELFQFFGEIHKNWGRVQASIVLALKSTIIRTLDSLPHSDGKMLQQIVASSPFRFIPRRFNPIVSEVVSRGPGEVLVAFVDSGVVLDIVKACIENNLNLREILVARNCTLTSEETPIASMIETATGLSTDAIALPRAGWKSTLTTRAQVWRPHFLTVVVACLLLLIAVLAPGWHLVSAHNRSQVSAANKTQLETGLRRERQLDSLRAPLQRVRSTAMRSVHTLAVLDQIAEALGSTGRMLSFEADSTLIQVTVLAPSLVPFLRRLERNPNVSDVALVGGIAHDSVDVGVMERAFVRFHYADDSARLQRAGPSR